MHTHTQREAERAERKHFHVFRKMHFMVLFSILEMKHRKVHYTSLTRSSVYGQTPGDSLGLNVKTNTYRRKINVKSGCTDRRQRGFVL